MPVAVARHLTLLVPGFSDPLPCPEDSGPPVLEALTASLPLEAAELLLARGDRLKAVPGDGSVEDVGATQHGQRRQEATEGPAPDRHTVEIEAGLDLRCGAQGVDLVAEHGRREVAVDLTLHHGANQRQQRVELKKRR